MEIKLNKENFKSAITCLINNNVMHQSYSDENVIKFYYKQGFENGLAALDSFMKSKYIIL